MKEIHNYVETAHSRLLMAEVIARDGLYCCKRHGCGKACAFDDLRLHRSADRIAQHHFHVLCGDCWTKEALKLNPTPDRRASRIIDTRRAWQAEFYGA